MEPMFPKEMLYNASGKKKTRSLFIETKRTGDDPFLSLKPQKNNGMISLRDLFIQYVVDDPSEVSFAEVVFGDYEFWQNLLECNWMDEYVKIWRSISDAKRKSKAFKSVLSEVENEGRNAYSAAKYIIEEPWKDKRNKQTKKEVQETTEAGFRASDISSDVQRLKREGILQ